MSTEEKLVQALRELATGVTDADLRMVRPTRAPRRALVPMRWLAVAGAAVVVVLLALASTAVLHRSGRGTASADKFAGGPTHFIAVDIPTGRPAVYDASNGHKITDVAWPGNEQVTALASQGNGTDFIGAHATGTCSAQLRKITLNPTANGIETTVSPVIATLPGQTVGVAETADGTSIAATLSCGTDAKGVALVDARTGAVRVWTGSVVDGVDNGISISPDGTQVVFVASLSRTGIYVLDTTGPGTDLSAARYVNGQPTDYPVLHLPHFIADGTLIVGAEGQKSGHNDAATYALDSLSTATGKLTVIRVLPARGWEGLTVDPTGRHMLARIGERILRVDDGHISVVVSKNSPVYDLAW